MRSHLPPALRLAAGLAFGLLGAALTGCDSTSIDPPGPVGPVVAFAASGVSTAEGSTVTIPVVLSGGTGAPVSVEVLFAEGASEEANPESICTEEEAATTGNACSASGPDFSGFGAVQDSFQVATVTFSGAAQDTVEVSFSIEDEGATEGAEEIVFALQRAEGATIGDERVFTVVVGTLPLAEVRARPNLATVTAEGVVTRTFGRLTYIQDETAAIAIFAFDDTPFGMAVANGDVGPGDRIQVTGKLCEFGVIGFPDDIEPGSGLSQITAPRDECFSDDDVADGEIAFAVLVDGDESDVPAPQEVTLAEIAAAGDAIESELVRVTDLTINPAGDFAFQSSKSYTVTDPTGSLVLRTPSGADTEIAGVPIPMGESTFEGVVGQFQSTNQLTPVYQTDVIPEL